MALSKWPFGLRKETTKMERSEALRKALLVVFDIHGGVISNDDILYRDWRNVGVAAFDCNSNSTLSPDQGEIVLRVTNPHLNKLRNVIIQIFGFQPPNTKTLHTPYLMASAKHLLRKDNISETDLHQVLTELCDISGDRWMLKYHFRNSISERIPEPECFLGMRRETTKTERREAMLKALEAVFEIQGGKVASDDILYRDLRSVAISAFSRADDNCPLSPDEGEIVLRLTNPQLNLLRNAIIRIFGLQPPKTKILRTPYLMSFAKHIIQTDSISDGDFRKVLTELCISNSGTRWMLKDHFRNSVTEQSAGHNRDVQSRMATLSHGSYD